MSCPDIENIISFAIKPILDSNDKLATHIYACPKCQEIFREVNYLISCEQSFNEQDIIDINIFLGTLRKQYLLHGLKTKLGQLLFNNKQKLNTPDFYRSKEINLYPEAAISCDLPTDDISIRFIAKTNVDDNNFWSALIKIPINSNSETMLKISCKNFLKLNIMRGELTLLGIKIPITGGVGTINFADFQSNLHNTEVYFMFTDNRVVDGYIDFDFLEKES